MYFFSVFFATPEFLESSWSETSPAVLKAKVVNSWLSS